MNKIEIIVPVYNEGDSIARNIEAICQRVIEIDNVQFSLLIVNDGSSDNTCDEILGMSKTNIPIRLLSFTRNFGKEAAMRAGIDHISSASQAIILMDSDLQHPPELIEQMVECWRSGYEVVEAVKAKRNDGKLGRRLVSNSFYTLFRRFARIDLKNHSDFKLLDRPAIDKLASLHEKQLFFRGITKWMGFKAAQIPFSVANRGNGTTKWSSPRLFSYSINAITSFSSAPLQLVTLAGILTFIISLVFGGIALYDKLVGNAIGGFTTVILLLLGISSILMFSLGLIGIYLAKIYDEIKARPIYIIDERKSSLRLPSDKK